MPDFDKIPKVGIPKVGIPRVGSLTIGIRGQIPKIRRTHWDCPQARDSEVRDSEDRDSEAGNSEAGVPKTGKFQGPLNSDTP